MPGVYGLGFQAVRTARLGRLVEQLGWDQKIGMIVAFSKDWRVAETRSRERFLGGTLYTGKLLQSGRIGQRLVPVPVPVPEPLRSKNLL